MKFKQKKFDIFLSFAQNIDCGYNRTASNEYNLCSGAKIRKIGVPLCPPILKVGYKGVCNTWPCFPDEQLQLFLIENNGGDD